MILIISEENDETVNYFIEKSSIEDSDYYRVNYSELLEYSSISVSFNPNNINFSYKNKVIDLEKVRSIWYRRPEIINTLFLEGLDEYEREFLARENEKLWSGILLSLKNVKWINNPIDNLKANNKPEQLSRAISFGLKPPRSIFSNRKEDVRDFYNACNHDIIIKPVSFGYIEKDIESNDCIIYTNRINNDFESYLDSIEISPVYFQEHIKKKFDIRVNYINGKLFAVAIHSQEIEENKIDFRRNNSNGLKYSEFEICKNTQERLLSLLESYNLNFAAIDFVLDNNDELYFLEINPNGQWAWIEQETGQSLSSELYKSLRSSEE